MAYHDVRLDPKVTRGFTGGPLFQTEVARSKGGREQRNIVMAQPLYRLDVHYRYKTPADFVPVRAFYFLRQARAHSFRVKDWGDYNVSEQNFGTGDGATTAFQLRKSYVDAAATFNRTIKKPVNIARGAGANPVIKVNGVTKTEGPDYTINYGTGLVTFAVAPTGGHAITWTGEFDVQVRFDMDVPQFQWDSGAARSWTNIALIGIDE